MLPSSKSRIVAGCSLPRSLHCECVKYYASISAERFTHRQKESDWVGVSFYANVIRVVWAYQCQITLGVRVISAGGSRFYGEPSTR